VNNFAPETEYVIAAYRHFERKVRELCAKETGISGPLEAGEARRMISKRSAIRLPGGKLWQELMMLKKVVNVLIESGGKLNELSLLHYCRKSGIASDSGRIRVTREYKSYARGLVIEFLKSIH
jgi:hypothetical protein